MRKVWLNVGFEDGMGWLWVNECRWLLEGGKGKKMDIFLKFLEGI